MSDHTYCRHEAKQVPRSEIRIDDHWGAVHEPDGGPAHTTMGTIIGEHIIPLIEGTNLAAGRHPKWQRVEPRTVIPAGQPWRKERKKPSDWHFRQNAEYLGKTYDWHIESDDASHLFDYFVDSSWKPPLVLPTEPTWGIPIAHGCPQNMSQWYTQASFLESLDGNRLTTYNVTDFIELTPEQVQRIEAAR